MENLNEISQAELTANKNPNEVSLQSVLTSDEFQNCTFDLPIVLGQTSGNKNIIIDLAELPHLLVGGATGQGKSVFLHTIIHSLLHKKRPEELKLLLIDTKNQEFSVYADLFNHFLAGESDAKSKNIVNNKIVISTFSSLYLEMEDRNKLLKNAHVQNIKEYNDKYTNGHLNPDKGHHFLPYIVVIIDEFSDLPVMIDEKKFITTLSKLEKEVGIHFVIATQRPSENVIGAIKEYFPAKVAFRVSSIIDSNNILDAPGAEHLLGRGDMLFSQGNELMRIQAAFIDTPEIEKIVKHISEQTAVAAPFILPEVSETILFSENGKSDLDPFYEEASKWAKAKKQVSRDQIQRKFAVGYLRAGRILEQLKVDGIVK